MQPVNPRHDSRSWVQSLNMYVYMLTSLDWMITFSHSLRWPLPAGRRTQLQHYIIVLVYSLTFRFGYEGVVESTMRWNVAGILMALSCWEDFLLNHPNFCLRSMHNGLPRCPTFDQAERTNNTFGFSYRVGANMFVSSSNFFMGTPALHTSAWEPWSAPRVRFQILMCNGILLICADLFGFDPFLGLSARQTLVSGNGTARGEASHVSKNAGSDPTLHGGNTGDAGGIIPTTGLSGGVMPCMFSSGITPHNTPYAWRCVRHFRYVEFIPPLRGSYPGLILNHCTGLTTVTIPALIFVGAMCNSQPLDWTAFCFWYGFLLTKAAAIHMRQLRSEHDVALVVEAFEWSGPWSHQIRSTTLLNHRIASFARKHLCAIGVVIYWWTSRWAICWKVHSWTAQWVMYLVPVTIMISWRRWTGINSISCWLLKRGGLNMKNFFTADGHLFFVSGGSVGRHGVGIVVKRSLNAHTSILLVDTLWCFT